MNDLSNASPEGPAREYYLKGRSLQGMRQYALAIEQFRASLALEPDNGLAHAYLALALSSYGQGEAALSEIKIALELETHIPLIHFIYGVILFQAGKPKESIPFFEQALVLYPDHAQFYMGLASSYHALKLFEEAEKNARKALEIEPENASATFLIGGIRLEQERYIEAWPFLETALRLEPEDSATQCGVGLYHLKTGDIDRALRHCREALRLEANNKNAKDLLVEALAHKNWLYATMWRWAMPSTNTKSTSSLETFGGCCGIVFFFALTTLFRGIYKIVSSGESLTMYVLGALGVALLAFLIFAGGIILLKWFIRRNN
jgi:tetratricopeptide (TPR) repeat protein